MQCNNEHQKSLETEPEADGPESADKAKLAQRTQPTPDIDEIHDAKQDSADTPP